MVDLDPGTRGRLEELYTNGGFSTVKQESMSDCGAAVCAMAVGKDLAYAKSHMQTSEYAGHIYYRGMEVGRFLAIHDILMGLYLTTKPPGVTIDADIGINFQWTLKKNPAILAVASTLGDDIQHWVFWDGEYVRDPKGTEDTRDLEDYEVYDLFPLCYVREPDAPPSWRVVKDGDNQ